MYASVHNNSLFWLFHPRGVCVSSVDPSAQPVTWQPLVSVNHLHCPTVKYLRVFTVVCSTGKQRNTVKVSGALLWENVVLIHRLKTPNARKVFLPCVINGVLECAAGKNNEILIWLTTHTWRSLQHLGEFTQCRFLSRISHLDVVIFKLLWKSVHKHIVLIWALAPLSGLGYNQ